MTARDQEVEWPAYGRDVQGTRYLPASGITRDNVHQLEVAWTYRTGETDSRFATRKPTSFQATPIVVDGMMYLSTPLGRVIALDPATGGERWVFDPNIRRDITYGDFVSRGVSAIYFRPGRSLTRILSFLFNSLGGVWRSVSPTLVGKSFLHFSPVVTTFKPMKNHRGEHERR